ncbi:hypothetical protein ICN48_13705 [Polynucleobacter sp. JS-Safj-400b-B2]|uniref:hypothetical protein n=1 Tax=Polynucleobacter sp. JS-Safj-400b-B2 TaxID=2576921 RepID=UPI001C0AFAEA|nr:hypothetical protein [Polynucleobacter sp. JS-Safj-400b-B2]MBU3627282.1 hypothetical protein [Polynucleobacter sp. JS-Safj-400b-B2]
MVKNFYIRNEYTIAVILGLATTPPIAPMCYYAYPVIPFILFFGLREFANESCQKIIFSITISSIISCSLLVFAYLTPSLFTKQIFILMLSAMVFNALLFIKETYSLKLFINKALAYYKLHPDKKSGWKLVLVCIPLLLFDFVLVKEYFETMGMGIINLQYINLFILGNAIFFASFFSQLYIYRK